jgi:phenylacetate-CoA ligase
VYWTALKTYFHLRRNLRLDAGTLSEQSWQSFSSLVRCVWDNVPFYRRHWESAGFSPDLLHSPEDIAKIPTTHKALFQQAALEDVIARGFDPNRLVRKGTSGSSGSPLNVYYTSQDRIYRTLIHLRILFHCGMTMRDRMVQLSDKRHVPDFRYRFQRFGLLPKDFICVTEPEEKQLEMLTAIEPAVIYSYASNMVLLAAEIEKTGRCPIHPKLIFTTGELLNPGDRDRITRAFGIPPHDIFGLVEMGDVAWQCPQLGGYHLNTDSFLAEVVADGRPVGPGESGRLVITNLHSRAMPFIRYEVGDVLTAPRDARCPCGCNFPLIDLVQGRQDDWLYLPDGQRISSMIFIVASVPGVGQYRIIQKALNRLVIEIVPGGGYTPQTLEGVRHHIAGFVGPGMAIDVHPVSEIPRQGGKIRSVICEVGLPS